MDSLSSCLFCSRPIIMEDDDKRRRFEQYRCHNCGVYLTSALTRLNLPEEVPALSDEQRAVVSGYIREQTENGITTKLTSMEDWTELFASARRPATVMDLLDHLLLYLYRKTTYVYEDFSIDTDQPAIAYAYNAEELGNLITALADLGYLEPFRRTKTDPYRSRISLNGMNHAEALRHDIESRQAFIASWFGEEIQAVHPTFKQAIIDAGYEPKIIINSEFNGGVVDEIIAEIRRSRFIVADLTGHRGGVYFEAGFALGLGLPVIFTCREDHLTNLHFDVQHLNFILWKDADDLQKRLTNRIAATIPLKVKTMDLRPALA